MATPYALRYALTRDDVDAAVLQWIKHKSPGHVVIRHDGDEDLKRAHWHALMWSDKKEQALRKDFKKCFPDLRGNAAYSLTEVRHKKGSPDGDSVAAYERYMCHAGGDGDAVHVVSSCGVKYTPQWFVEQNAAFYAAQRQFEPNKKKTSYSQDLVTELVHECNTSGISDRTDIAKLLLRRYRTSAKPLNMHFARSVINTVWLTVGGTDAHAALLDDLVARY